MKKGFTLIELAIVLVIVGLLIGGILAAQSIMSTAKVVMQVKQLQQFNIAANNFKLTYNCWPGEPKTLHNDGNDENAGYTTYPTVCDSVTRNGFDQLGPLWYEGTRFFSDLSVTGQIKEHYAFPQARNMVDAGEGNPFPIPAMTGKRQSAAFTNHYVSVIEAAADGDGQLFFMIDSMPYQTHIDYWAPSMISPQALAPLKPSEAAALDGKLDDGKPFTGNVVTLGSPNWGSSPTYISGFIYPASVQEGGACDNGSGSYNVSLNSTRCGLQIKATNLQ